MHLKWRQTLAMIVAVGALVGASARVCHAVPGLLRSPLVVTMSGTLQPFTEQDRHGLNTLTVTIADKQQWLFRVNRVDTLTGTDPGMMLLSELFPPELHIMGSTPDMAMLEEPSVAGKAVTLQGFLYITDRNFYVGEVSVAAETAQETR
jgi:hypothetical protein